MTSTVLVYSEVDATERCRVCEDPQFGFWAGVRGKNDYVQPGCNIKFASAPGVVSTPVHLHLVSLPNDMQCCRHAFQLISTPAQARARSTAHTPAK